MLQINNGVRIIGHVKYTNGNERHIHTTIPTDQVEALKDFVSRAPNIVTAAIYVVQQIYLTFNDNPTEQVHPWDLQGVIENDLSGEGGVCRRD